MSQTDSSNLLSALTAELSSGAPKAWDGRQSAWRPADPLARFLLDNQTSGNWDLAMSFLSRFDLKRPKETKPIPQGNAVKDKKTVARSSDCLDCGRPFLYQGGRMRCPACREQRVTHKDSSYPQTIPKKPPLTIPSRDYRSSSEREEMREKLAERRKQWRDAS